MPERKAADWQGLMTYTIVGDPASDASTCLIGTPAIAGGDVDLPEVKMTLSVPIGNGSGEQGRNKKC